MIKQETVPFIAENRKVIILIKYRAVHFLVHRRVRHVADAIFVTIRTN